MIDSDSGIDDEVTGGYYDNKYCESGTGQGQDIPEPPQYLPPKYLSRSYIRAIDNLNQDTSQYREKYYF